MPNPQYAQRLRAFAPNAARTRAETPPVTQEGSTATIRLYDVIDDWGEWWGISAREFNTMLDGLEGVEHIRLLVNSPGGIVHDGIAIMNGLRNHPARVTAIVEGLAASAASFIAVSADELVMMPNSELMIHDAWSMVVGNAADMRKGAEDLDRISDNMSGVYAAKAGGTLAAWREVMVAETWYSAEEAVEIGLADRVEGASLESNGETSAHFDLSIFKYAGRAEAPQPSLAHPVITDDESQRRRARELALLGL